MKIQYTSPTIPKTSTAALLPHPFPFFFCCATGGFGLGLATGFAGGAAGAGGGAFGGGAGIGFIASIIRVPPPLATPTESSVGSNTTDTSPNRTVAPGARG